MDDNSAGDVGGKLGLALAGGGFRASLFHAGALRRLAELDVLRRVEVVSAVSGGSIVAAYYALLLKRELERSADGNLEQTVYLQMVEELDGALTVAVQRNLRLRLLADPVENLRVMLTQETLGSRMGRLYERHLYKGIVEELAAGEEHEVPPPSRRTPGRIGLRDLRVRHRELDGRGSLERFNAARRGGRGSVVTAMVLNATTLNSGGRFTFSTSEIGDSELGLFRRDEVPGLLERKRLLEEAPAPAAEPGGQPVLDLVRWWRANRAGDRDAAPPQAWERVWIPAGFPGRIADAAVEMGALRRAEIAAQGVLGTVPTAYVAAPDAWRELVEAVREVDPVLSRGIEGSAGSDPRSQADVARLLIEMYLLSAAERVSGDIERDWDALSLGEAVAASASFPPVFPPVVHTGIYDDAYIAQLGLTDGGVHDNTGVRALIDAGCTDIIASDTGGLFDTQQRTNASRLRMAGRIVSILREVGADVQRESLRERRRVSRAIDRAVPCDPSMRSTTEQQLADFHRTRRLDQLAFFHISSPRLPLAVGPPPVETGIDGEGLARIRTDLDSFGEIEIALLVNHGYDTADRYVRAYMPRLVPGPVVPPQLPKPVVPPEVASRVVRAGRSRFYRSIRLLPIWPAPRAEPPPGGPRLRRRRLSGRIRKRLRGVAGNLLWLLGPVPLVAALLGSAWAAISWPFHRLFLRLTRVQDEESG
jgi:hypothetical protein